MDCLITIKTTEENLNRIDDAWKARKGYYNRSQFVRDAIENYMTVKD